MPEQLTEAELLTIYGSAQPTNTMADLYTRLSAERFRQMQEEQARRAFAPPLPTVLPPVQLPPQAPIATPSVAAGLVAAIARVAGGLGALLVPLPAGPRELDEPQGVRTPPPPLLDSPLVPVGIDPIANPDPEFELETVTIQPPRSRPPGGTADIVPDPIMPPNWSDLAREPYDPFSEPVFPRQPFFPIGDPVDRPGTDRPGTTRVPADPLRFPLDEPGTRPGPVPGDPAPDVLPTPRPGTVPGPLGDPGLEPLPLPAPGDDPRPSTGSDPETGPGLDLEPFANPLGDPTPTPRVPPGTVAEPFAPPTVGPGPTGTLDPFQPPAPGGDPLDDPLRTQPPREADACQCGPKKKTKKKKPKDRAVCYRGTYRQMKKGISYRKLEQIPCDSSSPSRSAQGARSNSVPILNF